MTAKIKLNAASGGGSFSLQAPSSSSNNRVFTLPDIADATLSTVNGVTEADTWRLTTSYGNTDGSTLDVDPVQSNLIRANQPINGYLGTGMTLNSGIWTFPSTGYWLVIAQMCINGVINKESRYNDVRIKGSVNADAGSPTYVDLARGYAMFEDYSTSRYSSFNVSTICDITNVSTHKVKFTTTTLNNSRIVGDTDEEQTSFKFIKLADT